MAGSGLPFTNQPHHFWGTPVWPKKWSICWGMRGELLIGFAQDGIQRNLTWLTWYMIISIIYISCEYISYIFSINYCAAGFDIWKKNSGRKHEHHDWPGKIIGNIGDSQVANKSHFPINLCFIEANWRHIVASWVIRVPPNHPILRVFQYKPSSIGYPIYGTPHFWTLYTIQSYHHIQSLESLVVCRPKTYVFFLIEGPLWSQLRGTRRSSLGLYRTSIGIHDGLYMYLYVMYPYKMDFWLTWMMDI